MSEAASQANSDGAESLLGETSPAETSVETPADAGADNSKDVGAATQKTEAKKAPDKPPTPAPEKYEPFTVHESMDADTPVMGEFAKLAKESNLSQEVAQKFVDLASKMQTGNTEAMQEAIETQAEQWAEESKGDKEFGGDAFAENLSLAKSALDQFGTPELKALLNQSKLGNHPEVLRFMVRAGKAISQDGFVPGRQSNAARKDTIDVLYKH